MKIIIHRYNSICEPDYIAAFKSLGIEVIEDNIEISDKRITLEKKVERLGETILTEQPLFVFSINYFPYIALVCEKLKCLYVCVSVDCPVAELFSTTIKSTYNRVFLFDRNQYNEIKDINPDCVFHLPLGVNVTRIDETIGYPEWDKIDYKYDVSFVGSLYNEKNPYLELSPNLPDKIRGYCNGLIEAQRLFSGQELLEECTTQEVIDALKAADTSFYPSDMSVCDIDKFVAVNNYLSYHITFIDRVIFLNKLAKRGPIDFFTRSDTSFLSGVQVHGGVSSLKEMPEVFRKSKININHTMRAIKSGLPQRIWDVLGSGGFLMTNYQAEIHDNFEIGKHIAAYETEEEAIELIDYYLSHEDERMDITKAGYMLAKEKNQVIDRVKEMIRLVLSTLEK